MKTAMLQKIGYFFVATMIFFLILGAGPSGFAEQINPETGGILKYGEIGNPTSLLPITSNDVISDRLIHLIYNSLIVIDETLKPQPDLAETWETRTNHQGNTVFVFKLRKDAMWHDDEPFTAEDVVFTFNAIMDKRTESNVRARFRGVVKEVKSLGPHTVKVVLNRKNSDFILNMNFKIIPRHLFKTTALNKKIQFKVKPTGTGPFVFEEWEMNEWVRLKANKSYFKGRPSLDRVIMRIYREPQTMMMELRTGGIDMVVKADSPISIEEFENSNDFNMYVFHEMSYSFIAYNQKHPFLSNKEVRRALTLGINRVEMLESAFAGRGQILSGPFSPISWAYNHMVRPVQYNPEKAKKILKEQGFRKNRNGVLEKNGKPFKLKLVYYKGYETVAQNILNFEQYMRDLGIRIEKEELEWSIFVKRVFDEREYDVTTLSWKLGIDPDISGIFHSSQIGKGKNNFIGYENPSVDSLLEQGKETSDFSTRRSTYNKIHERIHEDQPYTFLWAQMVNTPINKRIRGVKKNSMNIMHNVAEWWIPKKYQKK